MSRLFLTLFLFIAMSAQAYEAVYSAKEVQKHVLSLEEGDVIVLLDVDDTIITPKSSTFRRAPYNKIIDDIKASKSMYSNYEDIVSNWRLQRKAMLIDSDWPSVLNELKNTHRVFGLTKVNTGKFGNIESMEEWRYNELLSLDISFSKPLNVELNHKEIIDSSNEARFFHGIMMTGSATKAKTLDKYLPDLGKVGTLVFVDDREKNLHEIEGFCKERGISFLGLHYKGLEKLDAQVDEQIFELQKTTLINEARWVEDQEARVLLNQK